MVRWIVAALLLGGLVPAVQAQRIGSFDDAVERMEKIVLPKAGQTPPAIDAAALQQMQQVTQFVADRLGPTRFAPQVPVAGTSSIAGGCLPADMEWIEQTCLRTVVERGVCGRLRSRTVCVTILVPAPKKKKYETTDKSVLLTNAETLDGVIRAALVGLGSNPPMVTDPKALKELAKQVYALAVIAQSPITAGQTRNPPPMDP
jgi:hypothetical protein